MKKNKFTAGNIFCLSLLALVCVIVFEIKQTTETLKQTEELVQKNEEPEPSKDEVLLLNHYIKEEMQYIHIRNKSKRAVTRVEFTVIGKFRDESKDDVTKKDTIRISIPPGEFQKIMALVTLLPTADYYEVIISDVVFSGS